MKREQIAPRLIVMKTVLLTVAKSVFLKLHVKVKLKYKQITEIHLTSTGTQHYYRKKNSFISLHIELNFTSVPCVNIHLPWNVYFT